MEANIPPTQRMFQLVTGYWVSQAVGAVAALGIADALAGGPRTADDLAGSAGCSPDAVARLLRACASLDIVRRDEQGRFGLTEVGTTLRGDVPGSMRDLAIALTAPGRWLSWGRFRDAVTTGSRQTTATLGGELFEYYGRTPVEAKSFSGAMRGMSEMVALELARVFDASKNTVCVDVGGANGALVTTLLNKNPKLSGMVVDLPHVVAGAREAVAAAGLASRCEVVAGDFFKSVPAGDLMLLKHILHDWDDTQCRTILRNCAASLAKGGRVLVVEMLLPDTDRPDPAPWMDLNMLVLTTGRERSRAQYAAMAQDAGLTLVAAHATHSPFQVLELARA